MPEVVQHLGALPVDTENDAAAEGFTLGGPQDGDEEGAWLPAQGPARGGPQDGGEEDAQLLAEDTVEGDGLVGYREISLDALSLWFHLVQRGQRQWGLGSTGRSHCRESQPWHSEGLLLFSKPLKRLAKTRF